MVRYIQIRFYIHIPWIVKKIDCIERGLLIGGSIKLDRSFDQWVMDKEEDTQKKKKL